MLAPGSWRAGFVMGLFLIAVEVKSDSVGRLAVSKRLNRKPLDLSHVNPLSSVANIPFPEGVIENDDRKETIPALTKSLRALSS